MSVRKRTSTTGTVRWEVETRLPDRSRRTRSFRTRKQAQAYEAEVRQTRGSGSWTDPRLGKATVAAMYKGWLTTRPDLKPKVRAGYEDVYRLRVEPRWGKWPVAGIARSDVQDWVNNLSTSYGPSTVRWTVRVLKHVLDHAIGVGALPAGSNPAAKVKFPALPRNEHVYLTAKEVQQLADVCGDQGDVVMILAYTGLRLGELIGLNVGDVQLDTQRIKVRRSMTQVGGKLVETLPKTSKGWRTVPIPARIVPLLKKRIDGRGKHEPAVTSPRGGRLRRENWVRDVRWKQSLESIGIDHLRIHDLRHTYASLARSAGADLKFIQACMGHASIQTTGHIYADLFDSDLDRVSDALDKL